MTTPTDFLLAVEALTVSFDGFKAVDDLSFYVDPGEIRVRRQPPGLLDDADGLTGIAGGRRLAGGDGGGRDQFGC